VSDIDQALHALLRLQKRLIGRGSGASCCTDAKIVKIREDFKTIKDTLANLAAERDEARRECRLLLLGQDVLRGVRDLPAPPEDLVTIVPVPRKEDKPCQ
jgi:hypothetical protein